MKDEELKIKLVATYDGRGAKQAAADAEKTGEAVSKANKKIEETATGASKATEDVTQRLREQGQAARETGEQATLSGVKAADGLSKTKAAADGAASSVGALPGLFALAGRAAKVFQTSAGWFFGWLGLANQIIELFKKIHEWWQKKPNEEAARARAELLENQRKEAEKLIDALRDIDRKQHDAGVAAVRLENERAITAEYERRAELAERAASAQDRAQILRDERTGNLQSAARAKLDLMRLQGSLTEEQHKAAIYQLEKSAEANSVATQRADATRDFSAAYLTKKQAEQGLVEAMRSSLETSGRLGEFSDLATFDNRAKIATDAKEQYHASRGERDKASALLRTKLMTYWQGVSGDYALPQEFANLDWQADDSAAQISAALDTFWERMQNELSPEKRILALPKRRFDRLKNDLLPVIENQEGLMQQNRTTMIAAQAPIDALAGRLSGSYDVSTAQRLRAAVESEITKSAADKTRENEAQSALEKAQNDLTAAAVNLSTVMAHTAETLSARVDADLVHSGEMAVLAGKHNQEAAQGRISHRLQSEIGRKQQAANEARASAVMRREMATNSLAGFAERDASKPGEKRRLEAAVNLLTAAQNNPAMLRKITQGLDPKRSEDNPVKLTEKQRERYGPALGLAIRGASNSERSAIREVAQQLLAALAAESRAAQASAQLSGAQQMLKLHQQQPAAEQYQNQQHAANAASGAAAGQLTPAAQQVLDSMKQQTQRANAEAAAAAEGLRQAGVIIEQQAGAVVNLNNQIALFNQRLTRAETLIKNQPKKI